MRLIDPTLLTGIFSACIVGMALSSGCDPFVQPDDIPQCADSVLKSRPHPVIGGYTVYYGGFHNHCGFSRDAWGSPGYAYAYARCVAELDFFSLSDHDYDLDDEKWRIIKEAADSFNVDSAFTAFWGFEWTDNLTYGHLTVVGTDDVAHADQKPFQQFLSWLSERNCFAIFNHPGSDESPVAKEFDNFAGPVCEKIVGMELWNKRQAFSRYYYNDGCFPYDSSKGFYDEALSRGWKIGAAGGFDDHGGTWGTAVDYRLAVLAKRLTRQDIFDAMKSRRFYSTLDKNIALSFTIAGQEMGSTIRGGGVSQYAPAQIRAFDLDNEVFTEVVLFDKNHQKRRTWHPNAETVDINDTLIVASGDYYYVKITQQDGGEAISSPVWVSDSGTNGVVSPTVVAPSN
jgi:hypothetical protein